jgi:hypothetical protein
VVSYEQGGARAGASSAGRSSGFQGGVSAEAVPTPPGEPSDLQAPSGAPTQDSNFGYQGGPIIASPEVYASFWGASWPQAASTQKRENLIQFVKDFLASDYMNILSQYGVGMGAGKCGSWMGASNLTTVKGKISDSGIHASIQSLIDAGTVPEPASPSRMAMLLFLDESIEVDDAGMGIVMCEPNGDTAFGYHYYFTTKAGHQFYYSVIPALDDKCLKESCGNDSTCSLHLAASQEQRRTQVASHEFSEMVTDPEISAWRDPQNGAENGDVCNGRSATITVGGRTWTVQQMYSRVQDEKGEAACIVSPPNPIPTLLHPGWVGSWAELYSASDSLRSLRAVQNADGRLEVFGVNAQGHIWHTWQTAPNNGWVGGWAELYKDSDNLTMLDVARNQDGRLEVVGVNARGHIWHTWQTAPNNGWEGRWAEMYKDSDSLTSLCVVPNANGHLEVFGVNSAGRIWHTWQTKPNRDWYGRWVELYSDIDNLRSLRAIQNADGRLEVFGINAQGRIWHTWQTAPNNGWVGGWAELYKDSDNLTMLDVARNQDGRLEVFGVNPQGHIWHTWQTAPNNGWVGGWYELYSNRDSLTSLRAVQNADGRLEVFGVNAQGRIWHTWQTKPNNGWVGVWVELYRDSDNLSMLDVAPNQDGRLEVFGVNAQGQIWHTWQT